MSDLPSGWEWATLGDVAQYVNGRGFKKSEWSGQGRPIIRIQNLTGSGSSFNYFAGDLEDRHIVHPGDLLVSWAASLGVHVWNEPHEGALNQHIFKVVPWINKKYLRYALEHALADLRQKTHGSGMVHITRGKFDSTPIAVPPIAEQQRIVDSLEDHISRLDAANSSVQASLIRLRGLRARALDASFRPDSTPTAGAELVSKLARLPSSRKSKGSRQTLPAYELDLPSGWATASVGQLSRQIQYGTSSKTDSKCSDADVPVLRMGNIQDGFIDPGNLKYLSSSEESIQQLLLEEGDVLFNRTNSSELVGKAAVYASEPPNATFASYLIRCQLLPGVNPRWLSICINSSIGRKFINSVASQQVGQANVNGSKLARMPIPLPSTELQNQIVQEIDEVGSAIRRLESQLAATVTRSTSLRRSVLQHAFSGKLVDQDPSDEPAADLLIRVASEHGSPKPAARRLASRKVSPK